MVLTSCPKCRHIFALQAPPPSASAPSSLCPCRAATMMPVPVLGGAAPVVWPPAPAPPPTSQQSAMVSLSITATSGVSLNGGHVLVNTAPAPTQRISLTATLPAGLPALSATPWGWSQAVPPLTSWLPTPTPTPQPQPATWSSPWCSPTPAASQSLGDFCPQKSAQMRMTGGGILNSQHCQQPCQPCQQPAPVLLQPRGKLGLDSCGSVLGVGGVVPEQSPSTPLSFVLPGGGLPGLSRLVRVAPPGPLQEAVPEGSPENDLRLLQATTQALKQSGWYYEGFSWQESAATLRNAPPGTFLVRDSSDPRFLFSLSVQTDRGPTSVRLLYIAGGFRLDAEPHLAPTMPLFPCVLQLIEHYVANRGGRGKPAPNTTNSGGATGQGRGREQVWVDARGNMYSHILLTVPRRHTVPGLQHLARLAVNRQLRLGAHSGTGTGTTCEERLTRLELPSTLRRYVEEYPFTL